MEVSQYGIDSQGYSAIGGRMSGSVVEEISKLVNRRKHDEHCIRSWNIV